MPYPNFHSARIKSPGLFARVRVLQTLPNGIMIYGGPLKSDPTGSGKPQSYRFPKATFTAAEAKAWLKEHDIKYTTFEAAKKGDDSEDGNMKNVNRIDYFPIVDIEEDDYMQEKFQMTDEGYLKGRSIVTNIGVFTYHNADGSITRELRPPEEVFEEESKKSLSMVPLTNRHPVELIDSSNIRGLQVGNSGDEVRQDWYHLSIPLVITDTGAIKSIKEDGKRGISCGYKVDLEDKAGNWMGVPYDAIQRNIRYNHIAVGVDNPRAGDDTVIKLDSFDAYCVDSIEGDKNFKKEVNDMLKKIKIDNVEYDAEETVIRSLHEAQKKVDEFEKAKVQADKDHQELQAKHDSLKDENDQLKKDKVEAEKKNPDLVKESVKARITLLDTAKRAGIEVKEDMKDVEVMKAIIIKAFPKKDEEAEKEFKEKLDKADDAYVDARFESAVEYLEERGEIEDKNKIGASNVSGKSGDKEKTVDSVKARNDMIERMKNAHKDEEKK